MRRFPVWQSWRSCKTVEKLRFSDNLCSDCAEHESSESMKTSAILARLLDRTAPVHALGFHAFAPQKRTLSTD